MNEQNKKEENEVETFHKCAESLFFSRLQQALGPKEHIILEEAKSESNMKHHMETEWTGIDTASQGGLTTEQQAAVRRLREGLERMEQLERRLWWKTLGGQVLRYGWKALRQLTLPFTLWWELMLSDREMMVADLPIGGHSVGHDSDDASWEPAVEVRPELGVVVEIVHDAMQRHDPALVAVMRRELVERRGRWYVDKLVEEIDAWVLEQSRRAALFQEGEPIVVNANTQGAGGQTVVYAVPTDEQIRRAIRAALQVTGAANSVKWVGVWMAWQQDQRLQRVTEYRDFIALMQEDRFRQPDLPPCTETFLKVYNGDAYLLRTAVAEWNADEWRRRGKSSNTKSSTRHIAVMQRAAEAFQRSLHR